MSVISQMLVANAGILTEPYVVPKWNAATQSGGITLSNNDLTTSSTSSAGSAFCTQGHSTGKWFWCIRYVSGSGYLKFGVAKMGTLPASGDISYPLDFAILSCGQNVQLYSSDGSVTVKTYISSHVAVSDDVYMFALDMVNGALYIGKNGVWDASWDGSSVDGVPTSGATKTGATFIGLSGKYYPVIMNHGTSATLLPYGGYTPPTGYSSLVY